LAGAKIGKQRQLDAAMAGVISIIQLASSDPSRGSNNGRGSDWAQCEMPCENRAQQAQAALGDALGGYFGGGSAPSSMSLVANALMPPAIIAAPTRPSTCAERQRQARLHHRCQWRYRRQCASRRWHSFRPFRRCRPTLQQTVGKLVRGGVSIDDAMKFVDMAAKMTKTQSDALSDQQEAIGTSQALIPKA